MRRDPPLYSAPPGPGRLACLTPLLLFGLLFLTTSCREGSRGRVFIPVDSSDTRSRDLAGLVRESNDLSRFERAMVATGLDERLKELGPYTVFAPTNAAFSRTSFALDTLMSATHLDSLRKLMQLHVVRGRYDPVRVKDSLRVSTLYDRSVLLTRARNRRGLYLEGKPILKARLGANGVLYTIDHVITPPRVDTASADTTAADSLANAASPARTRR